jgi:aminoglycoside phosphotransferase (APT) family kinase protein
MLESLSRGDFVAPFPFFEQPAMTPAPRSTTYYWKCDRPAAFHGTAERARDRTGLEGPLADVLRKTFPGSEVTIAAVATQGNHLTFTARFDGARTSDGRGPNAGDVLFVRVDDGPERDDYIEVESQLLAAVRALGVPAPRVYAVDASRREVPFAWQVMDRIDAPDLNKLLKEGRLDLPLVAEQIGAAVARWQSVETVGFGPFDPAVLRESQRRGESGRLQGFHARYADYFQLHLARHLHYLVAKNFLTLAESAAIGRAVAEHRDLLELKSSCLVHKDLALWNILGTPTTIAAVIDWDDAIGGDPLDDLSLLACFHDAPTLARAVAGYETVRPLPGDFRRRFWLHLLRNMLFKAVIRVGAGYFDRTDNFFLIGTGSTGQSLRDFTHERLTKSLAALHDDAPLSTL